MSVGPISNPTPQVSTQQSQQLLKPAGKKNDGDGDEVTEARELRRMKHAVAR